MESPRNADLFNRLLQGKLSPAETEELISLLAKEHPGTEVVNILLEQLAQHRAPYEINKEVTAALEARLPAIFSNTSERPVVVPVRKMIWLRYSAVAAIILLMVGGWLWVHKTSPSRQQPQVVVQNKEVTPGRQGAILTLDDGRSIVLDSQKNGLIATQNGSKLLLSNGSLAYNKENSFESKPTYNTMTTAKGRQFQLQLPDGTKVWLNAASSIHYPTAFVGKERDVQVTGEVYFEVAKNPSMPFRVKIKDSPAEIEVLGTHFNINAYNNEGSVNTTLLEGSVRVSNGEGQLILKPGQQAQADNSETGAGIRVLTGVNISKVMAWKEGVFDFGDASLEEVMRQLERWYDIDVVYEKGTPHLEFFGKMSRDLSLSEVLHGLEVSEVHFAVEGRRLIVKP